MNNTYNWCCKMLKNNTIKNVANIYKNIVTPPLTTHYGSTSLRVLRPLTYKSDFNYITITRKY